MGLSLPLDARTIRDALGERLWARLSIQRILDHIAVFGERWGDGSPVVADDAAWAECVDELARLLHQHAWSLTVAGLDLDNLLRIVPLKAPEQGRLRADLVSRQVTPGAARA